MGVFRDGKIFWSTPIFSGTGKTTNFQFCMHILSIDRNKSSLQISGKVAVGVVRTLEICQGTHILGASHGRLCHSSAFLLVSCAGRSYFFSGQQYWQFNDARMRVQRGYPRPTAQHWFACSSNQPSSSRHRDNDDDVRGSSHHSVTAASACLLTLALVSHTALNS